MKRVIIESPFGTNPDGSRASPTDIVANVRYLHRCLHDSLCRGEAPFASHALYPLVLNDATEDERAQGIAAGFAWGVCAELVAVYVDRGVSDGMRQGIAQYRARGIAVEERTIDAPADADDTPPTSVMVPPLEDPDDAPTRPDKPVRAEGEDP